MIEPYEIDFGELINSLFDKMDIPGDGSGIAVARETDETWICVALGHSDAGGIEVRKTGEPYGGPYAIGGRRAITEEEFQDGVRLLDGPFKKTGAVFAPDVLGGESFLIKWCSGSECTRLVLGNPREIDDEDVNEFVAKLDRLLGQARDETSVWAR